MADTLDEVMSPAQLQGQLDQERARLQGEERVLRKQQQHAMAKLQTVAQAHDQQVPSAHATVVSLGVPDEAWLPTGNSLGKEGEGRDTAVP